MERTLVFLLLMTRIEYIICVQTCLGSRLEREEVEH